MALPKIRTEINDLINQLPESSLKYTLELLKEIPSNPSKDVDTFRKVLSENKKSLQKLTE